MSRGLKPLMVEIRYAALKRRSSTVVDESTVLRERRLLLLNLKLVPLFDI